MGDAAEFSPAEDEESCGAPESLEPASDSLEVGSLEGPLELSSQAVRTDRAESVNAANPTARIAITSLRWTISTRWPLAAGSQSARALPKSGASWCCRNTADSI